MPAGMTIIALDRGGRMIVLIPSKNAYAELTSDQFKNLLKQRVRDSDAQFEGGKREELIVDEDGGMVAGIPTRHYKIKISVTGSEKDQKLDMVAIEDWTALPSGIQRRCWICLRSRIRASKNWMH